MNKKIKGMVNPIMLVSFATVILLGIIITTQISTASTNIVPSSSTTAQEAIANVSANTVGAWQIVSVSPYVMGAVIILGIVGLLMARR